LYCFFEIAPLGVLFVAVWIIYRPTIAWRPVMACAAVLLLVWWPYLVYELGRAGLDVRSFVTGSASASVHDVGALPEAATRAVSIPSAIAHGVFMNFARSLSPIRAAVLCVASLVGLAFATTQGQRLIARGSARIGGKAAIDLHRFLGLALIVPWSV